MRAQLLVSSLLFGASTLAAQLNERFVDNPLSLERRQQFKPTTTTAEGSTCADAFGAGYVTCREAAGATNRLCYNPNMGQTCCSNSWACPSGSFCLVQGSCCPTGQSPQSCAAQNGLSVSSDFQVPTAAPIGSNSTIKATSASVRPTSTQTGAGSLATANVLGFAGVLLGAAAMM